MKHGQQLTLTDPRITIRVDGERVVIILTDQLASADFCEIEMTPENFTAALGRLAYVPCSMTLIGLEHLGNKHENKQFVFELPPEADCQNQKKVAAGMVDKVCPKGWQADHYFDSQGSFFMKDGKRYAACTIRRWVTPPGESR